MKTIPFNREQAMAGRPVVTTYNETSHRASWCGARIAVITYNGIESVVDIRDLFHPADPAPGHNPDGLDEWTVRTHEGWRLRTLEETELLTEECEAWLSDAQAWRKTAHAGIEPPVEFTYRTKRLTGYFLPKPNPALRLVRLDEIPAACWLKDPEGHVCLLSEISNWQRVVRDLPEGLSGVRVAGCPIPPGVGRMGVVPAIGRGGSSRVGEETAFSGPVSPREARLGDGPHPPVAEGGGQCGLENLRTLCLPCHRKVTAELKARLAKRSRKA